LPRVKEAVEGEEDEELVLKNHQKQLQLLQGGNKKNMLGDNN